MTKFDTRLNAAARKRRRKETKKRCKPSGGKLRQCGFCTQRVDRCICEVEKAPVGKLSKKEKDSFVNL